MTEKTHPTPDARPLTPRNRILAALPPDERERISPSLERVRVEHGHVLFEPGRPVEHVFFPENSVVSIVSLMADGSAVETATVGLEGMVGLPVFLDADSMAAQAFAQVPGFGYRMPAKALRDEVRRGGALVERLNRYTQGLLTLVSQSSACNRVHEVEKRCARWLLMTHDRVDGDAFDLTHLFLSQMLGVRRATVTEVAGKLQRMGLIEYTRGRITVVDRAGLETASCECYGVIRSELARLTGGEAYANPLEGMRVSVGGKSVAGAGAPDDADRGGEAGGG